MINLTNLTIIIVTYKTDREILENCLKSIDRNIKIKIIENSNTIDEQDKILLSKYKELTISYTGKNLGYGGGNNYGFGITSTDFVLVANPDIVFDNNFFINIEKYLNHDLGFSIIGTSYKKDKVFMPYGFFNESSKNTDKKNYINNLGSIYSNLKKVDWVTGCAMLINLKKFKKKQIFDENFFLYFEEYDLCKQIKIKRENVFSSADLLVHHLGFKGSFGADPELKLDAEKLREWHWMWSTFYFYKKNYSYIFAVRKTLGKLIRAFFKMLFYKITFNNFLKDKYKSRCYGLLNAIIGRSSWYRVDSKFQ
jgi:hypothetical protein|tara:strand:- start:363 stop:1289 length:927 start_codon:yes stop_codon:yes gene_type:complete